MLVYAPSLMPAILLKFVLCGRCQRTYIEVLRDMEPKELETEAKMTPPQIMEFFEACDTLMALPGKGMTSRVHEFGSDASLSDGSPDLPQGE